MVKVIRTNGFNVRYVVEVEMESGIWVKLNAAQPLRSNDLQMFQIKEPKTDKLVNLQLELQHYEIVDLKA